MAVGQFEGVFLGLGVKREHVEVVNKINLVLSMSNNVKLQNKAISNLITETMNKKKK